MQMAQMYSQKQLEDAVEKAVKVQAQLEALTSVAEQAVLSAIRTLREARLWSVSGRSNACVDLEGVLTDMHAVMHIQGWHHLTKQGGHPSGADEDAMDRPIGTGSCALGEPCQGGCRDLDQVGQMSGAWGELSRCKYGRLHALAVEAYMLMGLAPLV